MIDQVSDHHSKLNNKALNDESLPLKTHGNFIT